jgi:molybdopterin converting factor small subunit
MTQPTIQLKLFAGLAPFTPDNADRVPIEAGVTVDRLLERFDIPKAKAHLIFIDGVKKSLQSVLNGGERVGIFPPVAGG